MALEVTAAAVLTAALAGLCIAVGQRRAFTPEGGESCERGRSLWLWLLPVFLCMVCVGFLRAGQERRLCERELALGWDGENRTLEGTVAAWEQQADGGRILTLRDCGLMRRIQVFAENGADVAQIGAQVRVTGEIEAFPTARNPGEFDRRLYYRSRKMNYRMFADTCVVLGYGRGGMQGLADRAAEGLARLRVQTGRLLDAVADERESGIYRAVLLGDRSGMDAELQELYQKNGIAHLLAVSGLHLSLVSLAVYGGMRACGAGYGVSGLAGTCVLAAYAGLTGASPSVVRALLMACCGFAAAWLGRTPDMMSSWSLALLLLLWDSPYRLLQSGVQLSFGAIAGIGWLAPGLWSSGRQSPAAEEEPGHACGRLRCARQAVGVSVGIQLVTLPVLFYHFFQYPVYGIWLNFLIVPLMGGVVASGAAGVLLGYFCVPAGRFAMGSGYAILNWYELCCRAVQRLPGAVWTPGRPDGWKIGLYYGILVSAVWMRRKVRRGADGKLSLRPAHGLLLVGAVLFLAFRPVRGLTVTFLDVGQGDGICMQTEAAVVLVDGGSTDQKKLGEQRLVPFLQSQGITQVDCAVVTHADQDHISGLRDLLGEASDIPVLRLVLPACGRQDEAYGKLAKAAQEQGTQVLWMEQGQVLEAGTVQMTCLYPDGGTHFTDRNDHSLVLRVDYGDFHMLLTGDMTADGEQKLLEQLPAGALSDIQVLKAAHHGSDASTTEAWMDAVLPVWSVLSYGAGNRYGHPSARVSDGLRKRGSVVFETARDGAVTLKTDGKAVRWKRYLE